MPTKPLTPCATPGCPAVSKGRFCDKHTKQYKKSESKHYEAHRPSRVKRGYGEHWQKLRKMILYEDPLCVRCAGVGRYVAATQVDHIDGNAMNNARENLQALCASCHSRKTMREQGGYGNPKRG